MKIGLITDIHELAGSLKKALMLAETMRCDELACLGDIIGFDPDLYPAGEGRSASECVRLIKENCKWVVAGNHDREQPVADHDLRNPDREYLRDLPDYLIIQAGPAPILISHYLYPDFTGSSMVFVRRLNQLERMFTFLNESGIHLAFAGHDHPAGVGFGYPEAGRWTNRIRRAFHYLPFHQYELDSQRMVCLLPAVAARSARPGFTVWDTENRTLDVIQTTL